MLGKTTDSQKIHKTKNKNNIKNGSDQSINITDT